MLPHSNTPSTPSPAAAAPERTQRRRERLVIAVLAAVQFTAIVDFMVIMPLGPQLMRSLAIDPEQFGGVVSSYTFAAGAAGLVAAAVVDRFARRTAFLLLYAGFLAGTLCCALAPSYHALLAARIVTGAFGGLLGGMAMAIIGDVFPEHRRGRATGALMTGFALASTFGVPAGIALGHRFGWHVPFVALVVVGLPALPLAAIALPRLGGHLVHPRRHPLRQVVDNFVEPAHLNAFALMAALMIGGFAVIPFLATFLVANVGLSQDQLALVYVMGGAVTLVSSPLIGKLADRFGKLRVYRVIAPASAALMVGVTYLPPVPLVVAATVFSLLLVANSGRMIAAMAMITGSVTPSRRGGFLTANASVQHITAGVGAWIGGRIVGEAADHRLLHYPIVGWIAAATTLATLYLAGRVRSAEIAPVAAEPVRLAAAEAACDAGEPAIGA